MGGVYFLTTNIDLIPSRLLADNRLLSSKNWSLRELDAKLQLAAHINQSPIEGNCQKMQAENPINLILT